jgi:hypothetical protein
VPNGLPGERAGALTARLLVKALPNRALGRPLTDSFILSDKTIVEAFSSLGEQ